MPLLEVTITPNAFPGTARDQLARGLTEAAFKAESIPDLPGPRARGLALLHELKNGHFYLACEPSDDAVRGVFATLTVTAGVLDGARKAQLARDVQAAAETAAPDRLKPVVTSLVIIEVPEGQWCQLGRVMRLPEIALGARFEHLERGLLPQDGAAKTAS